jgi:hypothetical protein
MGAGVLRFFIKAGSSIISKKTEAFKNEVLFLLVIIRTFTPLYGNMNLCDLSLAISD